MVVQHVEIEVVFDHDFAVFGHWLQGSLVQGRDAEGPPVALEGEAGVLEVEFGAVYDGNHAVVLLGEADGWDVQAEVVGQEGDQLEGDGDED